MRRRQFSYDPQCADLAMHFLKAEGMHGDSDRLNRLAQEIQNAVEAWFLANGVAAMKCGDRE